MKLTEPIVFIRLAFGLPGRTRQLTRGAEAAADECGARRERINAVAKLFSSEAFSAIVTADNAAKSALLKLAIQIPTDFRGAYILPRALLDRAEGLLNGARAERDSLVAKFIGGGFYDIERDRAQRELGQAFNPADYPPADKLAEQFSMAWRYFALDVPEDLPAEVRERETAKLQAEINQVAQDCRQALREGLAELVGHLVDRLTPAPDGRKKKLAATTVEGLREFLDTLSARDITGDSDIRRIGEQARAVLAGISVDDLRDSRGAADRIRAGLSEVGKQIGALVKTEGARRFDFSEDEAPDGNNASAAA